RWIATIAAAERFAAHELLVARYGEPRCVAYPIRRVQRKHVDQLDVEIRVAAACRDMQRGRDRTDDRHILGERIRLKREDVSALRGEALVAGHVVAWHAAAIRSTDDGHRVG